MGQLWIIMVIWKKNYTIGNAIVENENNKHLYRLAETIARYLEDLCCLPHPGTMDIMPYWPESLPTGRVVLWRAEPPFQQCPLRVKHQPVPPSRPPYKYVPNPSLSPPSVSSLCLCTLLEKPLLLENRGGEQGNEVQKTNVFISTSVIIPMLRVTEKQHGGIEDRSINGPKVSGSFSEEVTFVFLLGKRGKSFSDWEVAGASTVLSMFLLKCKTVEHSGYGTHTQTPFWSEMNTEEWHDVCDCL